MDAHRRVPATSLDVISFSPQFSCFDYVEVSFGDISSIRRCFSLARSFKCQTLTVEDVPATGLVEDENLQIKDYYPNHQMMALKRLGFWRSAFTKDDASCKRDAADLMGYAFVKKDQADPAQPGKWHIFEAVSRKYEHQHNCIPGNGSIKVALFGNEIEIPGVLYCQQNGLNKACAHVALRTLLSRHVAAGDVPYRRMNEIAASVAGSGYLPKNGLTVQQIRPILQEFGVAFRDIDYTEQEKTDKEIRKTHPFQKYLYSGIESGCGGLLGFRLTGPKVQNDQKHIIPFFGHTFNKDTWVPEANIAYVDVGGGLGYIPSESWTSSFLGHDDNFGPDFCVPRLYVKPEQADYVVELIQDGICYGGVQAEALALPFLYALYPQLVLHSQTNKWARRLAVWAAPQVQQAIVRSVCVATAKYLDDLRTTQDVEGHAENSQVIDILATTLPARLWVVEVSMPHLFPTNERKVGDILLNPFTPCVSGQTINFGAFLLARLPGQYFVVKSTIGNKPQFVQFPSNLTSHIPLLKV